MEELVGAVKRFDVCGLHRYFTTTKEDVPWDFNKSYDAKEIIETCYHCEHIRCKDIIQMLIEYEVGKPNSKISGVDYNWVDVCRRNNVADGLKVLVHRGEKKSGLKKKNVKEIRKADIKTLFHFRGKPVMEPKEGDLSPSMATHVIQWSKFFKKKFAKVRSNFNFKAELAMYIDGGVSAVLYQKGIYFTPLGGKLLFQKHPLDESTRECGIKYRDNYSSLSCVFSNFGESSKKLSDSDVVVIKHRKNVQDLKIEKKEEKKIQKAAKKKKLGVFLSSDLPIFQSRSFFDVPSSVSGYLENSSQQLLEEKEEVEEAKTSKPDSEEEDLVKNNNVKKDGKTILCCVTNKTLYLVLCEGITPYDIRSLSQYIDTIMSKVQKRQL